MDKLIKNEQSGFGIIEVVIAASLMSVVALGITGLITSQAQQVSYMEDRMSHLNLKAEIQSLVGRNTENCTESLLNVQLPTAGAERSITLKDKDGNVIYDPADSTKNHIDKVMIDKVFVRDVDVHSGGTGSGEVEIVVNPKRMRKGGGPVDLAPVIIKQSVTMNTGNNRLTTCEGDLLDDASCVFQDFQDYRNGTFQRHSGQFGQIAPNIYTGSFRIPNDTVAFEFAGANGSTIVIYPGVTKLGASVVPKGGTFRVRVTGRSGYDHETQSGNQYSRYDNDFAWSYAGIDLRQTVYSTSYRSGKSPYGSDTNRFPRTTFDTVPAKCPRVNARVMANTAPDNLGVKLYKPTE